MSPREGKGVAVDIRSSDPSPPLISLALGRGRQGLGSWRRPKRGQQLSKREGHRGTLCSLQIVQGLVLPSDPFLVAFPGERGVGAAGSGHVDRSPAVNSVPASQPGPASQK